MSCPAGHKLHTLTADGIDSGCLACEEVVGKGGRILYCEDCVYLWCQQCYVSSAPQEEDANKKLAEKLKRQSAQFAREAEERKRELDELREQAKRNMEEGASGRSEDYWAAYQESLEYQAGRAGLTVASDGQLDLHGGNAFPVTRTVAQDGRMLRW